MRIALQLAITASLAATLCGLLARRRLGLCWSFLPYALAIIVCGNLATLWPERFFTPEFWLLKQALYDVCKLAIALELAWRVLRAFPGAQRAAARWMTPGLALSTLLVALGPPGAYGDATVADWQPRAMLGIAWLFTLTAAVMVWYRLPVALWHRALLLGFSGYLLVFSVALQAVRRGAWFVGDMDGAAYLALTLCWVWSAWRREPAPDGVPLAVLRRLGMEA